MQTMLHNKSFLPFLVKGQLTIACIVFNAYFNLLYSRMIYLTCLMMISHYNLQPSCSVNSLELLEVMVIGKRRNTIIKIVHMIIKYARFVV